MADANTEAGTLLAGLRGQLDLYGRIREISRQELGLVKDAELEKATTILAKKQELLTEVGTIEERIKPLKAKWPDLKATIPGDVLSSFQAALGGLSSVLEELIAIERETEEVLSGQIAIVRKQAAPAVAEEKVRRAYGVKREDQK